MSIGEDADSSVKCGRWETNQSIYESWPKNGSRSCEEIGSNYGYGGTAWGEEQILNNNHLDLDYTYSTLPKLEWCVAFYISVPKMIQYKFNVDKHRWCLNVIHAPSGAIWS